MRRLIPVVIALMVSSACFGGATVKVNPTTTEQAFVQKKGAEIADAITAGLEIGHATGAVINSLPLDTATKDRYDCGVMLVTGIDNPSAATKKVCGTDLKPVKDALLSQAREKLRTLTSCPSLGATAILVIGVVDPWVNSLLTSNIPSLVLAGTAIKTTFAATRLFVDGGAKCSA